MYEPFEFCCCFFFSMLFLFSSLFKRVLCANGFLEAKSQGTFVSWWVMSTPDRVRRIQVGRKQRGEAFTGSRNC